MRIGPVVRKDVMRASTMLEHEEKYACILAFDVKVDNLRKKYFTSLLILVLLTSSNVMSMRKNLLAFSSQMLRSRKYFVHPFELASYLGGERRSRDGGQRRSEDLPGRHHLPPL